MWKKSSSKVLTEGGQQGESSGKTPDGVTSPRESFKEEGAEVKWGATSRWRLIFPLKLLADSKGEVVQSALVDSVRGFVVKDGVAIEKLIGLEVVMILPYVITRLHACESHVYMITILCYKHLWMKSSCTESHSTWHPNRGRQWGDSLVTQHGIRTTSSVLPRGTRRWWVQLEVSCDAVAVEPWRSTPGAVRAAVAEGGGRRDL